MEEIKIEDEYITLGQFLKLTNAFDSGGFIKNYLQDEGVLVNGEEEHRRGRKLFNDDVVQMEGDYHFIVRTEK